MLSAEAFQITQTRGFDKSWYHAKAEFNNCFIINFSHNSFIQKRKRSVQPFCFWGEHSKGLSNQADVELDMVNAISAADIAFIMSSSSSAWLLSPLECSSQKQNGWTLRFCFSGWIMWKMYNKTIIEFSFRMISWIIKTSFLCYLPQPSASADNTDLGFYNSWYHAQPHQSNNCLLLFIQNIFPFLIG